MATSNKVNFGLKNIHMANITEDFNAETGKWTTTYGTVYAVPGAVSISLAKDVVKNIFYADDGAYHTTTKNNGYTGNLELAKVLASMYVQIFGQKRDNNGLLVETSDDKTTAVAIMFEIDGDEKATRYCLTKVSIEKPNIDAQTLGENVEVKTQTCDLTVMPRLDDGVVCISADAETDETAYNNFFVAVPTLDFAS